jgi:G3E family GTPase
MQVNLIFGFLGSGKTTLVRRLLEARAGSQPMAVIVNEFGDVGVDGAILEGRDVDMIQLTSGCLCCTLKGSLLNAIEELRDKAGIEHTVIEATGLAHPEEMIESFSEPVIRSTIAIGPFVTVVDAAKFLLLRDMLGEFYISQIAYAEIILLNKVDLISGERLEAVRREVREINPHAALLTTTQCDMDVDLVLDAVAGLDLPVPNGHGAGGHGHHDHAEFDSLVCDAGGEATRAQVEGFFGGLPPTVLRAKGFMSIGGQPCLVQFAAGQLDITPAERQWVQQMVFIGKGLDRAGIAANFAFAGAAREVSTAGRAEGSRL